jgi:hypothetical protein
MAVANCCQAALRDRASIFFDKLLMLTHDLAMTLTFQAGL